MADAGEDGDEDEFARGGPIGQFRIDMAGGERDQGSAEPGCDGAENVGLAQMRVTEVPR